MRKLKDPYLTMAKEKVVEALRAAQDRLSAYERLEHLRARDCAPFASETIALGEFDKNAPGETLHGEVYAPFACDGGIIRVVWRSADNRDSYVFVKRYEDYLTENLRSETAQFRTIGERILAERLSLQVEKRRPRSAA